MDLNQEYQAAAEIVRRNFVDHSKYGINGPTHTAIIGQNDRLPDIGSVVALSDQDGWGILKRIDDDVALVSWHYVEQGANGWTHGYHRDRTVATADLREHPGWALLVDPEHDDNLARDAGVTWSNLERRWG